MPVVDRAPNALDSTGAVGSAASRALTVPERRQREQAALRHGLRARSASNLKVRHYRAGRLMRRLSEVLALQETDLPAARAWSEFEVLAADAFSVLMAERAAGRDPNLRLLEQYRGLRRDQLLFAKELGMTPAARLMFSQGVAATAKDTLAARLASRRVELEASRTL